MWTNTSEYCDVKQISVNEYIANKQKLLKIDLPNMVNPSNHKISFGLWKVRQ